MTTPAEPRSPWLPVALYVAFVGSLFLAAVAWYGAGWPLWVYGLIAYWLVMTGWQLWLHLDRANVHDWAAQAADDADRSARAYDAVREHHNDLLARFEALCEHLALEVNTGDVEPDWAETVEEREGPVESFPQVSVEELVYHGATRWEPEPLPTVPQPVHDTTAAVAGRRHRRWDDDAAELDTRVEDLEVAHTVALLEHRMWAWRRGVAA